jgi:BTB/POZ domain
VAMKDISADVFLDFLRYLYTNRVENMPGMQLQRWIELLHLAHFYQVEGLKFLCENEMKKSLTESNAFDLFQCAHLYESRTDLIQDAFDLIRR